MHLAIPTRISPAMYSGWSRRTITANANISTGPTSQFCTSDSTRIFRSRKTSPSRSYRTLASGGYIISTRPIAIGTFVVPTWARRTSASAEFPANCARGDLEAILMFHQVERVPTRCDRPRRCGRARARGTLASSRRLSRFVRERETSSGRRRDAPFRRKAAEFRLP